MERNDTSLNTGEFSYFNMRE